METFLTRPDDWHLHLRDEAQMRAVLHDTARAINLPSLKHWKLLLRKPALPPGIKSPATTLSVT